MYLEPFAIRLFPRTLDTTGAVTSYGYDAREHNPERRELYELCWGLGVSQTYIASLNAEGIDWKNRVV